MYEVQLQSQAAEVYASASKPLAAKISRALRQLEREPHHHPNVKRLKGRFAGLLRYRLGDHRLIYRIDEADRIVIILLRASKLTSKMPGIWAKNEVNLEALIANRRDVYD